MRQAQPAMVCALEQIYVDLILPPEVVAVSLSALKLRLKPAAVHVQIQLRLASLMQHRVRAYARSLHVKTRHTHSAVELVPRGTASQTPILTYANVSPVVALTFAQETVRQAQVVRWALQAFAAAPFSLSRGRCDTSTNFYSSSNLCAS